MTNASSVLHRRWAFLLWPRLTCIWGAGMFRWMAVIFALLWVLPAQSQTPQRSDLMTEAFEAAQWAYLSSAGTALRQMAQRQTVGDDALADMLRRRQLLLDQLDQAERRLAAAGGDAAGAQLATTTQISGEIDATQSELALLDQQLADQFPNYQALTQPTALTIPQVQALLADDEGLVFVFSGTRSSFVWAITPHAAAWHRVDLPRVSMADSVAAIRKTLIQANTLRAAAALEEDIPQRGAPYDTVQAYLLYAELFKPLEPVLANVAHLYSVVDGPLSGLPLSLLITDSSVEASEMFDAAQFRRVNWFFQRHAMTTLPSVDALALVAAGQVETPQTGFLGFGDPDFAGQVSNPNGGSFFRAGGADLDSLRALAPLPGTRGELRTLARLLNAGKNSLYMGQRATETAVKQAPLDTAGVIAFATHGLLSGELRGLAEPALVLTPPNTATPTDDGLLTASEISELDLRADWIILSACNTAGSDGTPDGEGLSGLARAFLFAGARSLMVSHWPVRDDAAARLTTDTIAARSHQGTPQRKAQALQSAMQAMLMDAATPDLAHPAAWAPFVLVGHGGI